jgi:hypothetical protein
MYVKQRVSGPRPPINLKTQNTPRPIHNNLKIFRKDTMTTLLMTLYKGDDDLRLNVGLR